MLNIETLKLLNSINNIAITEHARIRLIERGIVINDVVSCIASGEIIKQYEDDKPFPSCLILGTSTNSTPIHIVVSTDGEYNGNLTSRPERSFNHEMYEMWLNSPKRIYNECNRSARLSHNRSKRTLLQMFGMQ